MKVKKFFTTRKVEMSDNSYLFEIVTPEGERVATASHVLMLEAIEENLNKVLEDAEKADNDFVSEATLY